MINYTGTYTDQYELTMAQVYYLSGRKDEHAVFDYFFRKLPFNSGYVIFAGLNDLLQIIQNLRFTDEDIAFLEKEKFDHSFIEYLKDFNFHGDIYSCREGEVIFPNEPVLRVEASLIEAQLIETLLLNILNFESLIATKAARIKHAAKDKLLFEFGLRRAQGPGGYYASRASVIGGMDGTSHVKAAIDFKLKPSGTMAHSFIQSEKDELTAFRRFSEYYPDNCILLLDTYSTLRSGLPNAIQVAKELESRGNKLLGVRLDSGDLAYLSRECRRILNEHDLPYVKIIASNQLDEYVIESLMEQRAPVDIFGVGTKLVTGYPDGALDGVYKLSELNHEPKLKLSDSIKKISLPHRKEIFRILNSDGNFLGADVLGLAGEKNIPVMFHPTEKLSFLNIKDLKKEPLLNQVMKNGKKLGPSPSVSTIKQYASERLALLPPEFKRFENPHIYKIGLSEKLIQIRDKLVLEHKERSS